MTTDHKVGNEAARTPSGGLDVKAIGIGDIVASLAEGCRDFWKAPGVSFCIAGVYTVGGWLLALLMLVWHLPYLIYPLAMGFALIAPFVASAFYEVSRRLEMGEPPRLAHIWDVVCSGTGRDLRWMALITAFAFFIWMDMAAMLTLSFFGAAALDMKVLFTEILTTGQGLTFLVAGHALGAVIAALIFSISAISFPLLHDRDVDVITAIITSVRLVRTSPVAMASWCVIIALAIVGAAASGLLFLPVILPVLGYATWHIYRRAVT